MLYVSNFERKFLIFANVFKFLLKNQCKRVLLSVDNLTTRWFYRCCHYQFCLNFIFLASLEIIYMPS